MSEALIFGAGKIARGFLGQILYNAGVSTTFVDSSESLVKLLNERGRYTVNVLGAKEKNSVVTGYRAIALQDSEEIAKAARDARIIFTAMGGKNLEAAAPHIAKALANTERPVNVITCENWKQPAQLLRRLILENTPGVRAGFAEAVVMRSAIEARPEELQQDALWVNVQNFWRLPLDADALIAPLPEVPELEPMHDFRGFLERKVYTYNSANGTVAFLGSLLGLTYIAEAARDPRVSAVLEKVYMETGRALSVRYGISLEEQLEFAGTSRAKLRDEVIVDTLERNARDPLRKLGPDDRLVGPALLALRYGVRPVGLATAIAAAVYYTSPGDSSAESLQSMREKHGAGAVLENVCKLEPNSELYALVMEKIQEMRKIGWIR